MEEYLVFLIVQVLYSKLQDRKIVNYKRCNDYQIDVYAQSYLVTLEVAWKYGLLCD